MADPTDHMDLLARRRAAQEARTKLAADRWTRFQAANHRRHSTLAARRPPPGVTRLLARAKSPGRMVMLAASGVWEATLDRSVGSVPGPTASLRDYVAAGPNPSVQPRALFDQAWYLAQAAGLTGSKWALLAHYLVVGDSHNLSPHPLLIAPAYRARHGARMANRGFTALEHFLFEGAAEGASPHPLFDTAFYVGQSEELAASGENPLVHYLRQGWRNGLDPHPLFAGAWYLEKNLDAAALDVAPLLHYVITGAAEGRDPHPLFDTATYLAQVRGRLRGADALSDFVLVGGRELKRPSAHFRPAYYLEQVGHAPAARLNPLQHYLTSGAHEGLWPAPDFDEIAYFAAHPGAEGSPLSALEHWTRHRTARPAAATLYGHTVSAETLFQELRAATAAEPGANAVAAYEALRRPRTPGTADAPVRVIAFRKTTAPDWLAVARALPNYRGHVQPRLPADGFADPADPTTLRRDIALAQRYGLGGFCHEIADERVVPAILAADFPFCLAWTGGGPVEALGPVLAAPQAIRVDGRPVLVLPADADAAAWREALGEVFLIQRARNGAGFDAHIVESHPARSPDGPPGAVINPDFRGLVHDHAALLQAELVRGFAPWPEIPFAAIARDTTPGFQDAPTIWHGAGPGGLQAWLEAATAAVRERPEDQRLVFLQAWNDWATGAVLAPDLRFGHGWLEAIANARDAALLERT